MKSIGLLVSLFFCSSAFAEMETFSKYPDFLTKENQTPACASSKSINKPPYNASLKIYQNPGDKKEFSTSTGGIFIAVEKKGSWMYVFGNGVMKKDGDIDHQALGWAKASDLYQMHQRNCIF